MFHRRIGSFYTCRTLTHTRLSTDVKRPQKSPVISPWSGSSGNYGHIFLSSKNVIVFFLYPFVSFYFQFSSPFCVSQYFPLFSLSPILCQFIIISIFISLSCFLSIANQWLARHFIRVAPSSNIGPETEYAEALRSVTQYHKLLS